MKNLSLPFQWLLTWGLAAALAGTSLFFLGAWLKGRAARPHAMTTDRAGSVPDQRQAAAGFNKFANRLDHLHRIESMAAGPESDAGNQWLRNVAMTDLEWHAFYRGNLYGSAAHADAALDRVNELKDPNLRLTAMTTLLEAWKPDQAIQVKKVMDRVHDRGAEVGLGMLLVDGDNPQPDLALAWCRKLCPGQGRGYLLGAIANAMLAKDPAAAAALGKDLPGNEAADFFDWLGFAWARQNPIGGLDWAANITDPVLYEVFCKRLASHWVDLDLEGAKTRLTTMKPGVGQNLVAVNVAARMAAQDIDAALVWLPQIQDPELRARAQAKVHEYVWEGVGLSYSFGVITSVTYVYPDSPAARSGEINVGDALLEIDSANTGQFASVAALGKDQVIALIRGSAGSTVCLRMATPTKAGFAPAHTVTLTRSRVAVKHLPSPLETPRHPIHPR